MNREQEHFTNLVNAYAHYGAPDMIGKLIEVLRMHLNENTPIVTRQSLDKICYQLRTAQDCANENKIK